MGARYTAQDDAIIKENYAKGLIPEWAHLLPGRTILAIQKRVRALGLTGTDKIKRLESRAVARFFNRIQKNNDTGCWEWTGTRNNCGYGVMGANNDMVSAHRFSWIHHFGEIADGLQVCHKCDNPCCVNPDHLFLGTQKDNMQDKVAKGRDAKARTTISERWKSGERIGKFTVDDVVVIKKLIKRKMSNKKIAARFGVRTYVINHIRIGKTWKHVEIPKR